jgi:molecular chaperone DnaK
MKQIAFGIDFGTTNSLLSVGGEIVNAEKPEPIWAQNQRPHPSVVWYRLDQDPSVGFDAKKNMTEMQKTLGNRFYRSIKRSLGKSIDFELPGQHRVPASRIAGDIFKHLKQHYLTSAIGAGRSEELVEAVVSIPIDFDGRARADLRNAMAEAGIRPTTFVHEPLAAAISHFYDPVHKLARLRGKKVLVFDWGGGTLDVCILGVSKDGKDLIELGTSALADLAGDDFDNSIMLALQTRFIEANKIRSESFVIDSSVEGRFRNRCESAKIELSERQTAGVTVPNFYEAGGKALDLIEKITRSEFEGWIGEQLDLAMGAVDRCLKDAGVQPELISHVLMVGGSSNIPAIRRRMEDLFGSRVEIAQDPDAAISRGAAIVAAEEWVPFAARRISVQLADDSHFPVLEKGAELVSSLARRYSFFCVDPRPGDAFFWFFDHPRDERAKPRKLDAFLAIPVNPDVASFDQLGKDRIVCDFSISENLTLRCNGRSSSMGKDCEIEIFDIHFGLRIG